MELEEHFVMTFAAPRKSGKSFFVSSMLRSGMLDHFDHIIILCPTLCFNNDYQEFAGRDNITMISEVSGDKIDELFNKQADCMRSVRKRQRDYPELPPLYCPDTLLILDDCIDSGVLNFRGTVDKIAERGRHINMSCIICSQRISAISRSVRLNSDYFIIFAPYSIQELEQFIEQFVSKADRKPLRLLLKDIFGIPYQFVLLDNTEKDPKRKLKTSNANAFLKGQAKILDVTAKDLPPLKRRKISDINKA